MWVIGRAKTDCLRERVSLKASRFEYVRAHDPAHAVELLHQLGGDARVIAGGQSLVPMMAMRLATPGVLIDINRIDSMSDIKSEADYVQTGATLTQASLASNSQLAQQLPLVAQAMPWIGHQQTRNRGTVGGSLVQADPSAELPLVAVVLNAQLSVVSHNEQSRSISAADFYLGALQTALTDTEMLQSIRWPIWPCANGERIGTAFDEVAIRQGDFAMASAACQLQTDQSGTVTRAALGLGGVDAVPLSLPDLAGQLVGQKPEPALIARVASGAAKACDPSSDIHASADYRRHLSEVLMRRVIGKALANAVEM
jgi:carbon-monoxide dehydrogenase medium subunit/2-furoyl-CoA dehydrogenase FAD binding subunit